MSILWDTNSIFWDTIWIFRVTKSIFCDANSKCWHTAARNREEGLPDGIYASVMILLEIYTDQVNKNKQNIKYTKSSSSPPFSQSAKTNLVSEICLIHT